MKYLIAHEFRKRLWQSHKQVQRSNQGLTRNQFTVFHSSRWKGWIYSQQYMELLRYNYYSNGRKQPLQRDHDLYLYQLNGSALSGRNNSKVWSVSEQKKLSISLDSVFKYLCIYKGTSRPDVSLSALTKSFKSAV